MDRVKIRLHIQKYQPVYVSAAADFQRIFDQTLRCKNIFILTACNWLAGLVMGVPRIKSSIYNLRIRVTFNVLTNNINFTLKSWQKPIILIWIFLDL